MAAEYSVDLCKKLERRFGDLKLHRPFRIERYDAGDELDYEVTPTDVDGLTGRIRLVIEKFVGGGFAGQVYRVRVTESAENTQDILRELQFTADQIDMFQDKGVF